MKNGYHNNKLTPFDYDRHVAKKTYRDKYKSPKRKYEDYYISNEVITDEQTKTTKNEFPTRQHNSWAHFTFHALMNRCSKVIITFEPYAEDQGDCVDIRTWHLDENECSTIKMTKDDARSYYERKLNSKSGWEVMTGDSI